MYVGVSVEGVIKEGWICKAMDNFQGQAFVEDQGISNFACVQ